MGKFDKVLLMRVSLPNVGQPRMVAYNQIGGLGFLFLGCKERNNE